jgi:hypothetical protein
MVRLSPARFETAYMVLEAGRDSDELTDDEQAVLNEAHAVLQEFEDRRMGTPNTEPLGKDPDGTTDVAAPEAERVEGMSPEDVS